MLDAIQKNMTWRAIPIAGLVAGIVFLLMNMILNPIFNDVDALFIIHYFASLIVGEEALTQSSITTLILGLVVHAVLSILFAFVIAVVIHRWGLLVGIIGGGLLGLALYGINFYFVTYVVEWIFGINNTWLLISHIVFGAVAGGVYESLDSFDTPVFEEEKVKS